MKITEKNENNIIVYSLLGKEFIWFIDNTWLT